ncbi:MAG: acyl-CoA dehydrogenase family protein [Deltaproteobacteria bacterium]|nr:acyl-CoA dehydrogenase family protein [Deltaproteobacteria bacterium]MBW2049677.1 acyl-CoA dehydrogenase family protein [Deltaproteobacteria bacterium]MBW2112060.1 acyl-CoA dehydrogenase family protein [Deltaproteobacteria bacterium]MBW2354397.1 acyl-CoA dehydrogenase family protein [Deltaproteobacteria bacterium]HDZ89401.1 acyl-CoA dehydrogenase [Deltaproteobacteria bacterium]
MYFNEDHDALRDTVGRFVDREINPHVDEWEEKTVPLHELFGKMGDLGLLGITYDEKYGGQGLDYWFDLVFLEELGHVKADGIPMAIGVQTHMATPAINAYGSAYLKETYLRPAISGRMVTAIGVTEPGAGSDVAGLKTRAVRDGDSYVINGSKLFITNGCQADFVTLLARTADKSGFHSFSLFVVPTDLPGFVVSRKLDKLGMRCSDTAELFFDDLRVPAENVIGEEGEGFVIQMKQFQHERFYALPVTYVKARDTIDMTVEYIRQRMAFGRPLIKNQVLRHRLADWVTEIECLKQLTYHIVRMKIEGLDVTREVSMGKLLAGQLSFKVCNGCLQMFGGMGYMNESLISRYFRDSRLLSIGGGADEIMRGIIAKIEGF